MLTAAKGAFAYTCETVTTNTTIQPKTISVQRDLPVGSVIGRVESDVVSTFKCSNESPQLTYQEVGFKGYGTYAGDFDGKRVWKTNIEGIGYAVGHIATSGECGAGIERWVDGTNTENPNHRVYCFMKGGMFSTQPMKAKAVIEFYKTASTTGAGNISAKTIGAFILRNNQTAWMAESSFSIGSVQVDNLSCTLGSAAINVPMGEVPLSAFKGPGTSPDGRTKAFNIPLTCSKGASINLKLEGTAHDAAQGMLTLSADSASAKGVAIQLLYGDKPVELAKSFKWQTTEAEGTYSIPLKARYVQTDKSVTTGVANGSATFTLTYQ
ncbi:type 1 fimbrial protein [Ralstonia sp. CHL-2022]|uniref:Type 1 fimbrial protein n=1 Tax=Ralstonia mojiangensis TaxID=2953895 RepID=A0ABT2L7V5_9RALS|nr:fimbrial protein [Ralstonia mojiangensis]MCT7296582.1 type 1 fimbrial protein [Ralstonia mojiangensis]MCT7310997.1 type 1 fimbrial protein [Ralstonia mojiangensis]